MAHTVSEMSFGDYTSTPGFALVLVKSHVSQHLMSSVEELGRLGGHVSDFFVLHHAHCAPNDEESVALSRCGVRTHIREIDATRLSETLNVVVSAMHQDVVVFLLAGDRLPSGFFEAMSSAVSNSPAGGLFYPAALELNADREPGRLMAELSPEKIKTRGGFYQPCVFSGLTVRKSHFLAMGGFHTGCQSVVELDFWLRTYLTLRSALVHVPQVRVHVKKPDTTWTMKNGARYVLEWSTLVRQFAGWTDSSKLMEYIKDLNEIADRHPELRTSLHAHICDMANRLLFLINPTERNLLQPWLQNSVGIPTLRPELQAIDHFFVKQLNVAIDGLPDLYEGDFSIHSVGSFCHAAQVLKDLGLRSHTGPFDWIFSSAAASAHMFRDRFRVFLDNTLCREVPQNEKHDATSNLCDHVYYKENFGVNFMFNHHRPFEKKDSEFFKNAVRSIESDLDGNRPCVLLYVPKMHAKAEDYIELWRSVESYSARKRLLVIRFNQVAEEQYLNLHIDLIFHQFPDVVEFVLPVVSKTNGIYFTDQRDNRRLRRLVYSYTQVIVSELRASHPRGVA